MSDMRYCADCAAEDGTDGMKALSEFYKYSTGTYTTYCKKHMKRRINERRRVRYASMPASANRRKIHDKKYTAENREKRNILSQQYRKRNPDKVRERYENWLERNREQRRVTQRVYYLRKKARAASLPARLATGEDVHILTDKAEQPGYLIVLLETGERRDVHLNDVQMTGE
jgi:hypothetical protein